MIDDKMVCEECGWKGFESDLLSESHPFMQDAMIFGCPSCREVDTFWCACDEPGCWEPVSCGTPVSESVYRRTCSKHKPPHK